MESCKSLINHVIPYIEGDGTGPDIWAAASRVFDASVEKAYKGKRKIVWKEVFAGEKAYQSIWGMVAAGNTGYHSRIFGGD